MLKTWEYLQSVEYPDLESLGKEGWELVALQGDRWIFKRPSSDPTERFTLEQRGAALEDVAAHQKSTRHLLNPEVAALIRRINHTQMLLIADRGFPLPDLEYRIDLSLSADLPTIPQVMDAILPDLPVDRVILAAEQEIAAPERWSYHKSAGYPIETPSHLEFKRLARYAVGWIRTGDAAPYANLLVVGG